jgi:hypothetical protein
MSVSRINLKTVIRNGINLKDPEMKEKISKVLSIRDALLRRGEKDPIDCYKLLAFSNACLDDCIAKMKHATPRQPYSFFVQMALDYSKWNSEKPDWTTVDTLRQQKLREFETERPSYAKASEGKPDVFKKTMPEKTKDTQKRDDVRTSNTNRTQLTKQQEREAAEARKTIRLSFEEELEGYEKQIELLRAKGWAAEGMLGYLIRCRDEFIRNSEPACPSQQLLIQ